MQFLFGQKDLWNVMHEALSTLQVAIYLRFQSIQVDNFILTLVFKKIDIGIDDFEAHVSDWHLCARNWPCYWILSWTITSRQVKLFVIVPVKNVTRGYIGFGLSVCLSVCPDYLVHTTLPRTLWWFLWNLNQMIFIRMLYMVIMISFHPWWRPWS